MMEGQSEEYLAVFFAGLATAAAAFTFFQALEQTRRMYRRWHKLLARPYLAMLWIEWAVNVAWALVAHFYMMGKISGTT